MIRHSDAPPDLPCDLPPVTRWFLLLASLVIVRSAVFVFWPAAHLDADQAITGLMAKHLAELRAFPVFWYGQTYMLAVEAWLAAPLMAAAGASVTALKLPLLAMNVAIVWLLMRGLTGDARLGAPAAAFAALFFVLAAPITTAHFLTANGGNIEPLLYVLLLWALRRHPIWMGLVLGIGFLNREFTIYGALALLLVDATARRLIARDAVVRYAIAFGTAGAVWVVFLLLRQISSAAGPGTSLADLHSGLAGNNLLQVAQRLCFDVPAMSSGIGRIFTVHWPELFGLEPQRLTDFGIESVVRQGLAGSAWLLVPIIGIPLLRLGARSANGRNGGLAPAAPICRPGTGGAEFPRYLMIVAALSVAGYLAGRCGVVDFYTMRYELLSVLGAVGLAARYLQVERARPLIVGWAVCCAAVFALAAISHARLLAEYASRPPVALKQELIHALDSRGVRYGYADYWTAYYVTFMTRERIIVAATEIPRVKTYDRIVREHRSEAILISRRPCPGGSALTAAFWACPTDP
jgi:hypothetical protein